MKVTYTTTDGRLRFDTEITTTKQAFEFVADVQEIFEEESCGKCGSKAIHFQVREYDKNLYYKMVCTKCRAQLDFGQHKEGGGLFIKQWDKEAAKPLPDRGWYIYQGKDGAGAGGSPRQQQESDPILAKLNSDMNTPAINALVGEVRKITDPERRKRLFGSIRDFATRHGQEWDEAKKEFRPIAAKPAPSDDDQF